MGLFGKLFSKHDPFAERPREMFARALEEAWKPKGVYKSALLGAEIRCKLLRVIADVEEEIGRPPYSLPQTSGTRWNIRA